MKLKFRFLEWLWPILKQDNPFHQTCPPSRERVENKYIIGLLILWLIVMLFGALRCGAQTRPLKVGDKVPDLTLSNVLNYKSKSLKLSDFKDKVVILDFWATWCSSCLAKFPEEYLLQRQLADSLQIVLVNSKKWRDSHTKVVKFFEDRRHLYDFPSIDEDTVLSSLFPTDFAPHFIWIKNGVVVAIPEPEDLTAPNVRAIYKNKTVTMASGSKHKLDFQKGFLNNMDGKHNVRFYSFVGAYRQDLVSSFDLQQDSAGNAYRIDAVNLSLNDCIQFCTPIDIRRILKKVSDPEAFSTDNNSLRWREKYRFIYESSFSPRTQAAAFALFRGEIERYFNLKIDTIRKDTMCLVITVSDGSKIIHGKKGVHGETNILEHLNTPVFFRNMTMSAIASLLEDQSGIPVLDNTRFNSRVILDLPANVNDLQRMSASFLRQGFRIERVRQKVTYLLLHDQLIANKTNPSSLKLNQ